METTAPLVNAIVSNALFHSNSHISQTPPQIGHILRFCLARSTDFVVNCIEVGTV